MESFFYSLSNDWLFFDYVSFYQLCEYRFIGFLDPVEGMNLVKSN